jgi:hypothetical protein
MLSLFKRILDDPSKFTFITENLGECRIDTPIQQNATFINPEDMYSLLSVRASYVHEFVNKYGTVPN